MIYPEDFTADDIMEFEYEYNRYLDLQDPNSLESINEKLALAAAEMQEEQVYDFEVKPKMTLRDFITEYVLFQDESELMRQFRLSTDEIADLTDLDLLEIYDKLLLNEV